MKRIALLDLPVNNSVPPAIQAEYWRLHTLYRYQVFYKHIDLSPNAFEKLSHINVGLGLIHSALKANGFHAELYQDPNKLFENINNLSIIGISCYTCNYYDAILFSRKAKEINPNVVIVIGGAHVTAVKEEVLMNTPIDFGIYDIGHDCFLDLVGKLLGNEDHSNVPNLIYRKDDAIKVNPPKTKQKTYPTDKSVFGQDSYDIARVFFRKGCVFNCAFCTNPRKYIHKFDQEVILGDMSDYVENFGTKIFYVGDEIFVSMKNMPLIKHLQTGNYSWAANSHIKVFTRELADLLSDSNCVEIDFGIESSNENIRRSINKQLGSNDEVKKVMERIEKNNLHALFYFIIGLPGQTEEIIKKEFEFMAQLLDMGMLPQVDIFTPYPGSDIYCNRSKYGISIHGDYSDMVRFGSVPYSYPNLESHRILELYLEGLEKWIIPRYEKMLSVSK